jgi:hypothetical protein
LQALSQAFFIPDAAELQSWIQHHPEYAPDQLRRLAVCIADSRKFGKKERAAFLASVDQAII